MNLKQPGGLIVTQFHGTGQLEGCIQLLCENAVEWNHSVITRTLDAFVKWGDDFDRDCIFRVGKILAGNISLKPYFCLFDLSRII